MTEAPALTIHRRRLLTSAGALWLTGASPLLAQSASLKAFEASPFRKISDADWRQRLGAPSYQVLRHAETEPPGSSPLNAEKRKGVFQCLGCGLPLFESRWKFESGTGWPSFNYVMRKNVGFSRDTKMAAERTEYHCAQCLGHQGHVFNDGPPPSGMRYCNNGYALKFVPA